MGKESIGVGLVNGSRPKDEGVVVMVVVRGLEVVLGWSCSCFFFLLLHTDRGRWEGMCNI